MTSLCVITPTISRPTLRRALTSDVMQPGDEWLVIGDGRQLEAHQVVIDLQPDRPWLRYYETEETGDKGNSQRNAAIKTATADYLIFLDDDDVFVPGAIEKIRAEVGRDEMRRPFIFRMENWTGERIWGEQRTYVGNVGGSMFVTPNISDKLARWPQKSGRYGTDFDFIRETLALWGNVSPVWSGELIIICRPEQAREVVV